MAANRALVTPWNGGSASPVTSGGSPRACQLGVSYVILDDTDTVVLGSGSTSPTFIYVDVNYDRLDNMADAVRAAVQTNENDPDLEVQVL